MKKIVAFVQTCFSTVTIFESYVLSLSVVYLSNVVITPLINFLVHVPYWHAFINEGLDKITELTDSILNTSGQLRMSFSNCLLKY